MDKDIIELTSKWYEYVGTNHHKDRDCHFTITLDYKYGDEPIFEIDHYGYVGEEFHDAAHTLDKAKEILLERIKQMIMIEGEWVDDVLSRPDEYDEWQLKQANNYNELFRSGK